MITFTLADETDSQTYTMYDVPFTDAEVDDGEEMITTLDGNVYVDFIYVKREWTRSFSYMSEQDYLTIKAFQERQRSTFKFPLLSIPEFNINNVPVYLQISERSTINGCGWVENVELTMRETTQQ